MAYLTTFTRIPLGPNSSAKHLLNISSADFDIEYMDIDGLCNDTNIANNEFI